MIDEGIGFSVIGSGGFTTALANFTVLLYAKGGLHTG